VSNSITIDGRKISETQPPYVVAEMSANHNGSLERALMIIEKAKKSGADAVKIQTYTPSTITLNCNNSDFQIKSGPWKGRTLYELYQWAHTPWDWHIELFKHAKKNKITIFSSPFDNTAVDLLEELNAPAYKIASFEAIDLALIKYVATTKKPMIISTGIANKLEIEEAIDTAHDAGCRELAILHCVSGYPAPSIDYNLHTLADIKKRYGFVTGLSDHTLNNNTAIASVALGAAIIEKHFTIDKKSGSPDDSFSLEPKEFQSLCVDCKSVWSSLGEINYEYKQSEKDNIQFRRSLYFVKDLKAGDTITAESIKSVRPGFGLAPKFINEIIGRKILTDIACFTPVKRELIK